MAPPPVLGDGDEPLGTGVLGDVGGGSGGITMSGSCTAIASVHCRLSHEFRGADGDRRRRQAADSQRSKDRLRARRKAYDREQARIAEAARKRREAVEAAEAAARKAQEAVRAAKVRELEEFTLGLQRVRAARLAQEDEDMAALLLLDAA